MCPAQPLTFPTFLPAAAAQKEIRTSCVGLTIVLWLSWTAAATKPEDWDDEEDGEWEPPSISNPKCKVGCGPWKRPTKPNPAYKGPWKAPMVDNPAYKVREDGGELLRGCVVRVVHHIAGCQATWHMLWLRSHALLVSFPYGALGIVSRG